jgi:N-acetylmuramoyl-L-alanine amidase
MMQKLVVLCLLSGWVIPTQSFHGNPGTPHTAKLRTIIIDPGHGGMDPGTHGLISKEKDVTLEIAMKLGEAIKKEFPDIKIVFTRTTDILPGNLDNIHESIRFRAELANKAKGDLFLSIHCNATEQPAGGWYAKRVIGHKNVYKYVGRGSHKRKKWVREPVYEAYWVKNTRIGTETYIWAADKSGSKTDVINQTDESEDADNLEDSSFQQDMTSPEARMRAQLYEKKYFDNSYLLASLVEDEFKKDGRLSNGVLQRNWERIWVLQATGMPSILVETGFLTNKEEEEYLNSEKGQAEVVQNIVDALRRYKDKIEGIHSELNSSPGGS